LRRLRKKRTSRPRAATPAMPPIIPPTIAPTCDEEPLEVLLPVGAAATRDVTWDTEVYVAPPGSVTTTVVWNTVLTEAGAEVVELPRDVPLAGVVVEPFEDEDPGFDEDVSADELDVSEVLVEVVEGGSEEEVVGGIDVDEIVVDDVVLELEDVGGADVDVDVDVDVALEELEGLEVVGASADVDDGAADVGDDEDIVDVNK